MILQRLRAAGTGWVEDGAEQMGAALAYYTLFSMAPLLFLAVATAGAAIGESEMRKQALAEVGRFTDPDTAQTVGALLDSFSTRQARLGTSIVGLVSLVFGATGMFTSLRNSLHRIWRLPPAKESVI